MTKPENDNDIGKGAVEQDDQEPGNSSMGGQLGHRSSNQMIKDNDSDFPEPGGNPEHSGEKTENTATDSILDRGPVNRPSKSSIRG